MTHSHTWKKIDEWTDTKRYGAREHYTVFKCQDPYCGIEKVILEETNTFSYEIDPSEYSIERRHTLPRNSSRRYR